MEDQNSQQTKAEDVPEELTITLRKPIKVAEQTVDQITLREPLVRELDMFNKGVKSLGEIGAMSAFIAAVSGVPKPFIDQMGARDFTKATEYLGNFLDQKPSQTTGATS